MTDHEKKEFTFEYGRADQDEIVYEFVFENEPTTVAFSKLEITGDREIPGAHLEVRDSKGNLIEAEFPAKRIGREFCTFLKTGTCYETGEFGVGEGKRPFLRCTLKNKRIRFIPCFSE